MIDRLWPLTFTIGILMAIGVFAFLAFSFCLVFGAVLSVVVNYELEWAAELVQWMAQNLLMSTDAGFH